MGLQQQCFAALIGRQRALEAGNYIVAQRLDGLRERKNESELIIAAGSATH